MRESTRVLLDTNIYGLVFTAAENVSLPDLLLGKHFVVCGSAVIRQELRDIPKNVKVKGTKLRRATLGLYDSFVGEKRNYSVTEFIETLAGRYNQNYSGTHPFPELRNDFLIVATASLHGVDIVVSNDEKTMASPQAVHAYNIANEKLELHTPTFYRLGDFKSLLK